MTSEVENTILHLMSQIQAHVQENPRDLEVVITELHSIINKIDPEIVKKNRPKLSLINPEFKPQLKNTKEKIFEKIGIKIKIPDLRYEADKLSQATNVPLPNSTRKNNGALLQWFDSNWAVLEPKLIELKGKIQTRN